MAITLSNSPIPSVRTQIIIPIRCLTTAMTRDFLNKHHWETSPKAAAVSRWGIASHRNVCKPLIIYQCCLRLCVDPCCPFGFESSFLVVGDVEFEIESRKSESVSDRRKVAFTCSAEMDTPTSVVTWVGKILCHCEKTASAQKTRSISQAPFFHYHKSAPSESKHLTRRPVRT